jgi:hypothetical protein
MGTLIVHTGSNAQQKTKSTANLLDPVKDVEKIALEAIRLLVKAEEKRLSGPPSSLQIFAWVNIACGISAVDSGDTLGVTMQDGYWVLKVNHCLSSALFLEDRMPMLLQLADSFAKGVMQYISTWEGK